jgi:hypothetical protein
MTSKLHERPSIPEKTQSLLKQMKLLNIFVFLAALPPGSSPEPNPYADSQQCFFIFA